MGINPTPPNALAIWGPYVFTLLFLTFGMRGLEPLKRFLYDRAKRRKQAKKNAAKPKVCVCVCVCGCRCRWRWRWENVYVYISLTRSFVHRLLTHSHTPTPTHTHPHTTEKERVLSCPLPPL